MKPYAQTPGFEVSDPAADSSTRELGGKSRRALLIAAILGLVGAALLMLYLRRYEEEVSGGGRVSLLVARKPIPRGALVTADLLSVSAVPRAYVEQRAVRQSDREKVVGVRTANALAPQDTLLWSDLALASEDRELSALVQPGKRAVTVRASESGSDPAGNGLLRPGDYVDVIVTLHTEREGSTAAIVLLQRVLVLAVGSQTQPYAAAADHTGRGLERELTLSLKLEEMQLLSLARERGTLSVALRAPSDAKVLENVPDMPLSSLYDKVQRETVQRRAQPLAAPSGPTRVLSQP